ncbi:MAG TPA: hypothetical protein VHO26_03635 [Propionibacteriaceae bacterium]|nr:hypothetical protein [Propionibacteriaceae bacterium]
MSRPSPSRPARAAAVAAASGGLLLLLAACGGGTSTSAAAPGTSSAPAAGTRASGGFRFGGTPAVTGLIAAWSNHTMQVQGATSQTAVTVTSSTRITRESSTTAKAVTVGSCVTVRDGSIRPLNRASGAPTPAATPPTASSGPITATSVVVHPAVNGGCTVATGAPSGSFSPRARPSGVPSAFPSGGRFRAAFGATGQVTALTSSGFVVRESRPGGTASVSVVTTSTTSYTTTATAGAAAIRTGECATALGKTDSTGAMTAASVVLSAPVNGSCTASGFGGRFQRNG